MTPRIPGSGFTRLSLISVPPRESGRVRPMGSSPASSSGLPALTDDTATGNGTEERGVTGDAGHCVHR